MTPIFQCDLCANQYQYDGQRKKCEAFPDGIPMEIEMNDFDHATPYAGDHGIRFSPLKDWKGAAEIQRRIFKPPPPHPEDAGLEELG